MHLIFLGLFLGIQIGLEFELVELNHFWGLYFGVKFLLQFVEDFLRGTLIDLILFIEHELVLGFLWLWEFILENANEILDDEPHGVVEETQMSDDGLGFRFWSELTNVDLHRTIQAFIRVYQLILTAYLHNFLISNVAHLNKNISANVPPKLSEFIQITITPFLPFFLPPNPQLLPATSH